MNQLCEFLHFNDTCPVCGKELTLYMHTSNFILWKANKIDKDVYQFRPFLLKKEFDSFDDYMQLLDFGTSVKTQFSNNKLGLESKTWQLFFFKACGTEAFNDNKYDYDINWYDVCYYRSSAWFEFNNNVKDKRKWELELINPDHKELINRDESLIFKKLNSKGTEKVYALNLDYEGKNTKLWCYSTTTEQRLMDDFSPNIFEKDNLPLLHNRPDFTIEARDQLISKLESWIILS